MILLCDNHSDCNGTFNFPNFTTLDDARAEAKRSGWIATVDQTMCSRCQEHEALSVPLEIEVEQPENPFLQTRAHTSFSFVCSWCFASSPSAHNQSAAADVALHNGWKMLEDDPLCAACQIKVDLGMCQHCCKYAGDAEDHMVSGLINHHPSCVLLSHVPINKKKFAENFKKMAETYCRHAGWSSAELTDSWMAGWNEKQAELEKKLENSKAVHEQLAEALANERSHSAVQEIKRLASFILHLDAGVPTINEQFPNGMSAVDAAIIIITDLKNRLHGEDELAAKEFGVDVSAKLVAQKLDSVKEQQDEMEKKNNRLQAVIVDLEMQLEIAGSQRDQWKKAAEINYEALDNLQKAVELVPAVEEPESSGSAVDEESESFSGAIAEKGMEYLRNYRDLIRQYADNVDLTFQAAEHYVVSNNLSIEALEELVARVTKTK